MAYQQAQTPEIASTLYFIGMRVFGEHLPVLQSRLQTLKPLKRASVLRVDVDLKHKVFLHSLATITTASIRVVQAVLQVSWQLRFVSCDLTSLISGEFPKSEKGPPMKVQV